MSLTRTHAEGGPSMRGIHVQTRILESMARCKDVIEAMVFESGEAGGFVYCYRKVRRIHQIENPEDPGRTGSLEPYRAADASPILWSNVLPSSLV